MIPFNRAGPLDETYVMEALSGGRVSGDGPFGRRSEALLESLLPGARVLLTTSCTHALEASALLLDLRPGDEVIVPSFTFVSTANAYVLRGARIVFADVRPDTLNLDEKQLASLVTSRTRAIVPVHYAGVGCEMDQILAVAKSANAVVIEDNAHGLFGAYKGKPLGTFGAMATQSFHDTKNVTSGEGGALVLNDRSYAERAEILREKGTDRSRFFRGQVDKYGWVDLGSSWVLSDVLAAVLLAQLEAREKIQARRRAIWERYARELADWSSQKGVRLPIVPAHCEQAFHMFYLLLPDLARRTAFIEHMKQKGVQTVFHYLPLNRSKMGLAHGAGACPVTERVSDQLVRLPLFASLSDDDQSRVLDAVRAFG